MGNNTTDRNGDSNRMILYVVASYWLVSISMVYINKVLLSNNESSLQAPLFITCFQCIVACIICYFLGEAGNRCVKLGIPSFTTEWSQVTFSFKTSLSVLPLSIIFVAMVGFNNLCLQYVEVSFYNVARCLSLVFNVILSYLVLGKTTNSKVCMALAVVVAGFILGVDGEVNFSLVGTIFGVLSSLFVSLSFIYTAKILALVDNNKSVLIFYNNVNAVLLLQPLVLVLESRYILDNLAKMQSIVFWMCMLLASVLGFSVALVTVLQIKYTSPLTHNISGTAKAAVQSLLAFYIWGNPVTSAGIVGLFLVLAGSAIYTVLGMQAPPPPVIVATDDAGDPEAEQEMSLLRQNATHSK